MPLLHAAALSCSLGLVVADAGEIRAGSSGDAGGSVATERSAFSPDGGPDDLPTVVSGSLDKGLIRDVIKANIGEIRRCYEAQLARSPKLAGRVSVKFVVSATGAVSSSTVAASTTGDPELDACVASRVGGFVFPAPQGGGVVVVTYPFIFKQSAGEQHPAAPPDAGGDDSLTVVMGTLDKELIRQVIQKHIGEIRHCYEGQLKRSPKLAGKVTVKFVVSATGAVASSTVAASTTGDLELDACVARRVHTWVFPQPEGGGIVVVSYPFVFAPSGN